MVAPRPPTVPSELPPAAIRLECNNEDKAELCDRVMQAASSVASKKYQLTDPAKLEALLVREPSLRGCRRDDCRAAIAERLEVSRLLDIIVQSPPKRGLIANVALFDLTARGISMDTEVALKREEAKLRRTIEEAVDLVVNTQRLTASLKLDIKPEGAKVRLDSRGTAREVTDAERDGKKDLRVFLGSYTVHVEKPGYVAQDVSVTVAQTGASLSVTLRNQPVSVKLEWTPNDARVQVDGEPVDSRDRIVELSEGKHKVEAIAPRGSSYQSTVFDIDVHVGMEPIRIALQRLTELYIKAPRGYTVSLDSQVVPSAQLQVRGLAIEGTVAAKPGEHTVTATSWRGVQISRQVDVTPLSRTEAVLSPPSLAPGVTLMVLGAAGLATGGALIGLDGSCARADCLTQRNFIIPGAVTAGVGGALFLSGAIWFAYNAANHPLFHRPPSRTAALPSRFAVVPTLGMSPGGEQAGILTSFEF